MTHESWDDEERAALDELNDALDEVRLRHAGDPPLDVLAAASGDALPPAWQAEVQTHLDRSVWSRTLLEGGALGDAPLDAGAEARMLDKVRRQSSGARRRTAWWLIGGTLAASLITGGLWLRTASPGDVPETTAAAPPGSAVAPPASALPLLAFELPALQAPLSALTWRGETATDAYVEALAPAYDAYRAGDHRAADLAFRDAAERFPDAFEVLYYGGLTRLVLGRQESAVASLSAALAQAAPSRVAEVTWNLAIAEQRAGKVEATTARLEGICASDSPWAERACDALKAGGSPDQRQQ